MTNLSNLLHLIQQACLQVPPPHPIWEVSRADPDNELELEDISYIEQMFVGTERPIAEITGISWFELPEPDDLNEQQKETLAIALTQLLEHHNFQLDFPESYPMALRYALIRDFWMTDQVPLTYGMQTIELCSMEPENCPFPGYCTVCDEVAAQMTADSNIIDKFDYELDISDLLPNSEELDQWMLSNPDEENSLYFKGGFFNDDGNPVSPLQLKVPGLCVLCQLYQTDEAGENLLCTMNRYDQRNDDHFVCGAFIPDTTTNNQ